MSLSARSKHYLPIALTLLASSLVAQTEPIDPAVEQLRHAAGKWDVTTKLLKPDGSIARSVEGSYEFDWVVPDRVLIGRSLQPELGQDAGILFYYEESKKTIGMSSVGADGHLWVMTGPADQEVRSTPPTPMSDGSTLELRFTRYNVEPDRFESKMEYSTDGGASWVQGNHQAFRRRQSQASASTSGSGPEPPSLSWDNLAERFEAEAEAGFTGAVLVVRDGEVMLDQGYGLANRELGLPVTPTTIFATGSLPIDYTHTAILWLAQQGRLELSDPITRYFDNVPEDKRSITIEHLMTGGSGLPDFTTCRETGTPITVGSIETRRCAGSSDRRSCSHPARVTSIHTRPGASWRPSSRSPAARATRSSPASTSSDPPA